MSAAEHLENKNTQRRNPSSQNPETTGINSVFGIFSSKNLLPLCDYVEVGYCCMYSFASCFTLFYAQVQHSELNPLGAISSPTSSISLSIKILLPGPSPLHPPPPQTPTLHSLSFALNT